MVWVVVVWLVAITFALGFIQYKMWKSWPKNNFPPVPQPIVTQQVDVTPLIRAMDDVPHKVLQSIQSSTNTYKGALGELMGYISLRASYDRIIPLGNIVDFMCIKFPKDGQEGHIDFVDIKTGDRSRLSKDQRDLQKLIENKHINFIKLKVETASEDPTS